MNNKYSIVGYGDSTLSHMFKFRESPFLAQFAAPFQFFLPLIRRSPGALGVYLGLRSALGPSSIPYLWEVPRVDFFMSSKLRLENGLREKMRLAELYS